MPYKDPEEKKKYDLLYTKRYRLLHPHKKRVDDKTYRIAHPEQTRKNSRVRRAKKQMLHEEYSILDASFTRELFNNQCFNCGSTKDLVIDHVYPLSKGYALTRKNACILCDTCNKSKTDHMPEDFYTHEKLWQLFCILSIHSAFTEACDSLTCSCL
jgi:5-methylcytosine-specific restriction endonuclease McrA